MAVELFWPNANSSLGAEATWGGVAGRSYTLPESLLIEDDDARRRYQEEELAFSHGVKILGEEWDSREIRVEGKVYYSTRAALRQFVQELKHIAAQPGLRLRYDSSFWCYPGALRSVSLSWRPLWDKLLAQVSVRWQSADPFWYSETESSNTQNPTDSMSFAITPTGAYVECGPVITFTAPNPGTLTTVALRNQTDGNMEFSYTSSLLKDGAVLVVDCEAATVKLNGVSDLANFSGEFLRLLPLQSNLLQYTGGACTIQLKWRVRWP